MAESYEERKTNPSDRLRGAQTALVRVKLSDAEDRVLELRRGSSVETILEIVAEERGCGIRELILVREGETKPLSSDQIVDGDCSDKLCHHVHYVGDVKVLVHYQEKLESREFKRFEAVEDVLIWAIEEFAIDRNLATEFVLVRHGQKEELRDHEHIGHLASKCGELALDLVRADIANGSGQ